MNWEKANVYTKLVVYMVVFYALVLGAVCGAMAVGAVVAVASQFSGWGKMFGVVSAITFYFAGMAGIGFVRPILARWLLPQTAPPR